MLGWIKSSAGLAQTKLRGRERDDAAFIGAAGIDGFMKILTLILDVLLIAVALATVAGRSLETKPVAIILHRQLRLATGNATTHAATARGLPSIRSGESFVGAAKTSNRQQCEPMRPAVR